MISTLNGRLFCGVDFENNLSEKFFGDFGLFSVKWLKRMTTVYFSAADITIQVPITIKRYESCTCVKEKWLYMALSRLLFQNLHNITSKPIPISEFDHTGIFHDHMLQADQNLGRCIL